MLDTVLLFHFVFFSSSSSHLSGAVSAHGHTCAHTSYLSDLGANLPRSTFASAESKKKKGFPRRARQHCAAVRRNPEGEIVGWNLLHWSNWVLLFLLLN